MPTVDLGSVVGPQGPRGYTGDTGQTGAQGDPGPNQVSATTSTTLNGVLSGDGEWVGTTPVDSAPNALNTGNLISSAGVANALANEILYYNNQAVSVASGAEIMRIPASGTDSKITTDTIVLECTFANSQYIQSDVTWTSYAGYIAFTGTCTTATTANVTLGRKGN